MLKIGDTVKVINNEDDGVFKIPLYPIGTIGTVAEIGHEEDGSPYYTVCTEEDPIGWSYPETQLEKGHMEWVAEK